MQAKEIAQSLARDAEAICSTLLPNGKRSGHEWEAGDVEGGEGKSLKVRLTGEKAGVWADFATGDGGDLLDLWAKSKGLSLSQAMGDARDYLGIRKPTFHLPPKTYRRPAIPPATKPTGRVLTYLTRDRGLTPDILNSYKVSATPEDNAIIFSFLRDGELVSAKRLMLERTQDGKKDIRPTESGCEPALFGWQAIPADARAVVITEGEIDAVSCAQLGHPALSVPFGGGIGGKQAWIEIEYDRLDRFDEIFLCFDNDREGQAAVNEIADRLGVHRIRVVDIPAPHKDANDLLRAGVALTPLIESARYLDPQELKSASLYVEDVIREMFPSGDAEPGINLPFNKLDGKLTLRSSELSLWNGVNGHGKSQLVGQTLLAAAEQGYRVCIASMELKPSRLLMRLTKQAAGMNDEPSIPFIRAIHDWYKDKFWIFDLVGSAKTSRLLEVFRYARKRYGIRVFVIDSLLKCGIAETDYDGQKQFIEELTDFKNEFDCHVMLVTHSRKGESEHNPTGKFDVRGSGTIADLCDTGVTIWRNKKKEDDVNAAEFGGEELSIELLEKPDAVLYCWKQRNGDWEKQAALWWHQPSFQFLQKPNGRPKCYVSYSNAFEPQASLAATADVLTLGNRYGE